jgi:hypothetical protein
LGKWLWQSDLNLTAIPDPDPVGSDMRSRVGSGNFKTTMFRQEERRRQWHDERSDRDSERGEKWPMLEGLLALGSLFDTPNRSVE